MYTSTVEIRSPTIEDGKLRSTDGEPKLAADEVRSFLGEPDKVEHDRNGEERWIYHGSARRWTGVLLVLVIVPVPLCIPVGKERLTIIVRDHVAVAGIAELKHEYDASYGMIGGPCGPSGFGWDSTPSSSWEESIRKNGLEWPHH